MPGLVMKLAASAVVIGTCAAQSNGTQRPPEIDFPMDNGVNKKPRFKIYPGGEKTRNATWMGIEFGKIQEMRAGGGRDLVQSHSINSLASESSMNFTNSTITMYNVSAQMIEMNLTSLSFNESDCQNPASTRPSAAISAGTVAVQVIIFNDDADVPYSNYTVPIKKGQMKFNIKATDWPFCMANNSLSFALILTMPGDDLAKPGDKPGGDKERKPRDVKEKPPPMNEAAREMAANKTGVKRSEADKEKDKKNDQREAKRPPGKKFSGDGGGGKDVSMDLPELVLLDGVAMAAIVECVTEGGKTVIKFTFPYFNNTMVYDPVVSFDDPVIDTVVTTTAAITTTAQSALVSGGGRPSAWGTMVLFLVGFMLPRRAQ